MFDDSSIEEGNKKRKKKSSRFSFEFTQTKKTPLKRRSEANSGAEEGEIVGSRSASKRNKTNNLSLADYLKRKAKPAEEEQTRVVSEKEFGKGGVENYLDLLAGTSNHTSSTSHEDQSSRSVRKSRSRRASSSSSVLGSHKPRQSWDSSSTMSESSREPDPGNSHPSLGSGRKQRLAISKEDLKLERDRQQGSLNNDYNYQPPYRTAWEAQQERYRLLEEKERLERGEEKKPSRPLANAPSAKVHYTFPGSGAAFPTSAVPHQQWPVDPYQALHAPGTPHQPPRASTPGSKGGESASSSKKGGGTPGSEGGGSGAFSHAALMKFLTVTKKDKPEPGQIIETEKVKKKPEKPRPKKDAPKQQKKEEDVRSKKEEESGEEREMIEITPIKFETDEKEPKDELKPASLPMTTPMKPDQNSRSSKTPTSAFGTLHLDTPTPDREGRYRDREHRPHWDRDGYSDEASSRNLHWKKDTRDMDWRNRRNDDYGSSNDMYRSERHSSGDRYSRRPHFSEERPSRASESDIRERDHDALSEIPDPTDIDKMFSEYIGRREREISQISGHNRGSRRFTEHKDPVKKEEPPPKERRRPRKFTEEKKAEKSSSEEGEISESEVEKGKEKPEGIWSLMTYESSPKEEEKDAQQKDKLPPSEKVQQKPKDDEDPQRDSQAVVKIIHEPDHHPKQEDTVPPKQTNNSTHNEQQHSLQSNGANPSPAFPVNQQLNQPRGPGNPPTSLGFSANQQVNQGQSPQQPKQHAPFLQSPHNQNQNPHQAWNQRPNPQQQTPPQIANPQQGLMQTPNPPQNQGSHQGLPPNPAFQPNNMQPNPLPFQPRPNFVQMGTQQQPRGPLPFHNQNQVQMSNHPQAQLQAQLQRQHSLQQNQVQLQNMHQFQGQGLNMLQNQMQQIQMQQNQLPQNQLEQNQLQQNLLQQNQLQQNLLQQTQLQQNQAQQNQLHQNQMQQNQKPEAGLPTPSQQEVMQKAIEAQKQINQQWGIDENEDSEASVLDFTSCYVSPIKVSNPNLNAACIPVQRDDNPNWLKAHEKMVAEVALHAQGLGQNLNFLFLGDSIIERLRGTRFGQPNHWLKKSNMVWQQMMAPLGSLALGISGDGTQHLLWRLQNGELPPQLKPKVVVLLIGTNNVYIPKKFNPNNYNFSAHDIALAIRTIVKYIQQILPSSQLLILGLLPRGEQIASRTMSKINGINKLMERFAQEEQKLHYLDCSPVFINQETGQIQQPLMEDYLHPTAAGYQQLFIFLLPFLNNILCAT